jgi:hypothetical protein
VKLVIRKKGEAARAVSLESLATTELESSGQAGISPREFHRRHPGQDLIHHVKALAAAAKKLRAKASWSPIRGDQGAAQEARYHMHGIEPAKED